MVEEMTKEKDSRISQLQLEIEKLANEKQSLKVELASKNEEVHKAKRQHRDEFFGV
jgi:hypothetical protein